MNKQLVDHWIEEFDLKSNEAELLESFSVLMDRNSLWLMEGRENEGTIEFVYTDEALHYKFSLSDMRELMNGLDAGESLDWDAIDEEYTIPRPT
jgi:hypothetical protein